MDSQQMLWLVIGVVVALIIIAVVIVWAKRSRDRRREAAHRAAEDLRGDAARQQGRTVAEEKRASAVRQDADAAEEEAQQLRAEAEERERTAGSSRSALDAQMQEADRLDPEVRTDREGHRLDGAETAGSDGEAAAPAVRNAERDPAPGEHPGAATDDRPADASGKHAAHAPLDGDAQGPRS